MNRPSWKELSNKIRQAIKAVSDNAIRIVDPAIIAVDALELGYQVPDLQNVLLSILQEIGPEGYAGYSPPQKAYKNGIDGLELFAFRWPSKFFGCEAYLKFCLRQDLFYLVSLHQHREGRGDK